MPGLGKLIAFVIVVLAGVLIFVFFVAFAILPGKTSDGDVTGQLIFGGLMIGLPVIVGIVAIFIAVAVFVRRFRKTLNLDLIPGSAAAAARGQAAGHGLPASGLVTSVRDTGITINNIRAVMEVVLRITLEGRAPYDVSTRVTIGRHQFGVLQPGVTVPVWVDPEDPERVAVDLRQGSQQGAGGTIHAPGGAFQVAGLRTDAVAENVLSTDDIIARGIPGEGEIRAATHTGATAQQMAPGHKLKAGEHDDPMVHLMMMVTPTDGAPFQTQAVVRVPDGMLEQLTIGRKVPVACLPDQQTAVIDWKALRYYRG